jgi:hypothetical protein
MAQTDGENPKWFLVFVAEEDEAVLRVRYILKALQEDPHVDSVETYNSSAEPHNYGLIVRFRQGRTQPANKSLQHLDKIYGSAASTVSKRSRYDTLLSEEDPFEKS